MGTKVKAAPVRRRVKQVGGTLAMTGVVAGVVLGSVAPARASVPDTATRVPVTAGVASDHVDAHLQLAGSISGRLTSVAGNQPISAGVVGAYRNGALVRSGFVLDGAGGYTIKGLAAGSYAVCVNPPALFGGGSSTGYVGRCFGDVAFDGHAVPSGAALITVPAGTAVTGKDVTVPSGAAIAGRVTTSAGTGLRNVFVYAQERLHHASYFGSTDAAGAYTIKDLPPSSAGYTVCFSPVRAVTSGAGYQARCFKDVRWTGVGAVPSTARKVSVTTGHVTTGVNQALPAGGAIAGTITDAVSRKPVKNDSVVAFDAAGHVIGSTTTDANGRYAVRGLAPATGDRLCASPLKASPSTTYQGRCWKTVGWHGGKLPAGTKAVAVSAGRVTGGINLALPRTVIKLGSIAGTITDKAGHPLKGASVLAFTTTGASAGHVVTAADGSYRVTNLPASSTGYVVCAKQTAATTGAVTPQFGWAPRCSVDAAWVGVGVPSSAKRWPLGGSAPWNRTGVKIALPDGGAITGSTFFGSDQATGAITVELFTGGGKKITSMQSDFVNGQYSFTGLSEQSGAAGYVVCFDGRDSFSTEQGYEPQCFDGRAWDGSA